MRTRGRSKRFAKIIFFCTFLLAGFTAYKGLEGATSAVFSTGVLASTGLYANKQFQDRKWEELQNDNNNGNTN